MIRTLLKSTLSNTVDSMTRVSKTGLLSILYVFDERLPHKILLVAVGGTAMTMLGIKASTKDIDFNIPEKKDYEEFVRLYKAISPGVAIDYYPNNTVFTEVLPEDYLSIASDYKSNFENIRIKVLNPVDIVCSKISRCDEADIEDIKSCIEIYGLKKNEIATRAGLYARAGSDEIFQSNLNFILENLF